MPLKVCEMSQKQHDPQELARAVAVQVASEAAEVGDFVTAVDEGDHVTDFRFASHVPGYENWQWSVTLYHDSELDSWTVDESSLVPAEGALLPPQWVPWKDRLLPEDLSVTDVLGTDADDPRMEPGLASRTLDRAEHIVSHDEAGDGAGSASGDGDASPAASTSEDVAEDAGEDPAELAQNADDLVDAAVAFHLTREHVMSVQGRAETAKRWYEGQHGPKSLSTKTADGLTCEECGFMIPLQGELGRFFGVCANKWSADDGKVVALDHGCGEHSEIEAAPGSSLWVQSEPAYDDLHIDVVRHARNVKSEEIATASKPSDAGSDAELPEVEILESLANDKSADATVDTAGNTVQDIVVEDIVENTVENTVEHTTENTAKNKAKKAAKNTAKNTPDKADESPVSTATVATTHADHADTHADAEQEGATPGVGESSAQAGAENVALQGEIELGDGEATKPVKKKAKTTTRRRRVSAAEGDAKETSSPRRRKSTAKRQTAKSRTAADHAVDQHTAEQHTADKDAQAAE
ncbi:Protein of unknown function (DUF3027) [Bifidobacterium psychraerophilum DSM 22366]|uniref:DUF3027 family protein n=2 Tax=Bifidobacterium psychraerophilum TaxID=218140 RepID=A0A087CGU9_9BIFI|nr:hypothetical protein BPSY_1349 [Bifidobacterium psychraerophilum]PKA95299.1 Protein of unknown function (DUF3027) [Bifidobacterium psychraerophilum DSM 22366]